MAYEFKKLSEVEALNEVPDGANALVEVGGEIKRVPGNGLGGAGGIATAIIKSSDYDSAVAGVSTYAAMADPVAYSCINMTYEEARAILKAGKPLSAILMKIDGDPQIEVAGSIWICNGYLEMSFASKTLYWTSDGISTTNPSGK